jgi:hypothetical protein
MEEYFSEQHCKKNVTTFYVRIKSQKVSNQAPLQSHFHLGSRMIGKQARMET